MQPCPLAKTGCANGGKNRQCFGAGAQAKRGAAALSIFIEVRRGAETLSPFKFPVNKATN